MSKTGILISACLMVKNEERNLSRCLTSLKKFVDEIIVVDTGSTDKTVEIAKSHKARVYEHPWQNDFSLHRNQSLSYARGKWVAIIDADEELIFTSDKSMHQLRKFFEDCKYNAAALIVNDIQKGKTVLQFNSTRFFKRGQVRYEGIVHNQPRIDGQALFCPLIQIKHYGYDLTSEQKKIKFDRTSTLLLKQVETGEVSEGLPYFYLCQLYANNGLSQEAVGWGEKYLTCKEEANSHFNESIYFTMIKQYTLIGDIKKAKEWLNLGLQELPGDLDLSMAALEHGVWIKDQELIISAAKDFCGIFNEWQKNPALKKNRFIYTLRPEALAFALFHLCSIQLQQGSHYLQMLMEMLTKAVPHLKDSMLSELEGHMAGTLFPLKFVTHPQPNPVMQPAISAEQPNFVTRMM